MFTTRRMEYVLTERFSQNALEEYFGNQRKIGRRYENPDAKGFGYNDNTIRIQRNVSHTSGNAKRTIRQEKAVRYRYK